MAKRSFRLATALPVLAAAITLVFLQSSAGHAGESAKSPFINDMLGQLDRVKEQILTLEGATPQDKFTWRPAEGVRSISEVYLHLADGNYGIMSAVGAKPPVDMKNMMDQKKRESATTDKAKIASALTASFEWTKSELSKLTDADLEKEVDFFGSKSNIRNVLFTLLSHVHEHLGQSIAYARSNGVAPPWTAERQARMKERMKK